ncbi:MAG: DUF885 family protein [Acidobacteriota bacterium]|nr:DUF885 family protein [Acidobacteriota bacterium]
MKKKARVWVPAILLIAVGLSFFQVQAGDRTVTRPSSGEIMVETSELAPWIERFSADRRSLERHYDLAFSPERFERMEAFLREWLGLLNGVDFDGLSLDGRIDFLLFKNLLHRDRQALQKERQTVRAALPVLPYAEGILALARDLKRMIWVEGRAAAAELNRIRAEAARAERALSAGSKADKTAMRQAVSMAGSLRRSLKDWFSFYNGYDPLFTWWASETYEAADTALRSHEAALRKVLGEGPPGAAAYAIQDPVGRGVLLEELAFEFIPYTPEEILAIGWKELEWCEKERLTASREMGFGDDWMKAMERVKDAHVEPGGQPELIRFLAFEAIDFLEEHEAVTIPPMVKELIRMDMMPLERQQTTPFFTGGEVISVAYPADAVPFERKISTLRGNNPHFSRAVVHHELVPGHNLQGFMAARHRTYRRPFQTSFYGEGWPLYWEMRLWDMGFQRSPEDRIGMLFWRMHRCARIIFSMSYHLGKMSVDEAIDLLVDRVGHERALAEVEVKAHLSGRAYGGRPLAQISYLTGGLQLRALSKELVDSGRMTAREFHDAVLKENSIPIELLRAKLVGQDLPPGFKPRWKFYEGLDK